MEKTVHVAEEEGEKIYDLPLEENDGSLLYSTLLKYFPNAKGLRFYTEVDTIRGVKLSHGKFFPPHINWGSTVYYCVFLQELENEKMSAIKAESSQEIFGDNEHDLPLEVKMEEIDLPDVTEDSLNKNLSLEDYKEKISTVANIQIENRNQNNISQNQSNKIKHTPELRILSPKRPHRCDICGNCFTQQSHMQRHRRIHTGEKPFSCEACGEKFSRSDKLKLHTYKCHAIAELVHASSTNPDVREKREKPKILDDSYEWGTLPPVSRTKHLAVKFKKTTSIDIDITNGEYYSVVNMVEVKMEDSDDQKYYDCEFCSKIFSKKNQLQRHARTHTGERPFACKLCDKSFTRIDALKRHTASEGHKKKKELNPDTEINHSEVDPLLDTKNEVVDIMNGIKDEKFHPKIEYDDEEEIENELSRDDEETSCDVASFAQVTYANFDNTKTEETEGHDFNQKKNKKDDFCDICQHTFTNKYNYVRHMKSHDKISKSFRCPYCHYMFRRQSHLTRHVLIHTGEKPFHCTQCEEKFSRSDKLKLHISRIHSEPDVQIQS